eukprot:CAMPEP_0113600822 /NCGR_PEP_ID=MMETSP0015_2-20120614/42905_1 /TAXON_ID=2838 /ORGANISM="Odontella" /LENGTH=70 /DNA_ID=CAMNT_0000509091 /DNA_START=471 /DNA_END=680 /DNA_ORIENTATION=+ /assembly_acc=CAM_ASM_000160
MRELFAGEGFDPSPRGENVLTALLMHVGGVRGVRGASDLIIYLIYCVVDFPCSQVRSSRPSMDITGWPAH